MNSLSQNYIANSKLEREEIHGVFFVNDASEIEIVIKQFSCLSFDFLSTCMKNLNVVN